MIKEQEHEIIQRIKNIPKEQQFSISDIDINSAEKELGVVLPNDFKLLCKIASYEFSSYGLYNFPTTVIKETTNLRKACNLPHKYLVLESTQDPGPILMKI